ncbi:MAG TPA: EamA family transporter [Acidimicrobiia bacterium]
MIAVALGLVVATAFGSGDWSGGRASSRASTLAVLLVAQVCSLAGAAVLVLFVSAHAHPADIGYGAVAGAVNVVGLGLLYRSLARHAAGVVAPITAVVGALVPVVWGLAHGERPSALALTGVALAVVAGALIARGGESAPGTSFAPGVVPAVAAGVALGSSLVLYAETSKGSGQVPVLAGRAAAVLCMAVAVFVARRRGTLTMPTGSSRGFAVAAGLLDVAATATLLVAVRRALLSLVAPIASLAPGWTVLLTWIASRERLTRTQWVGIGVALAALVCIASG